MTTTIEMSRAGRKCPRCGSRDLHAVAAGANTNLFCAACSACWHAEDGALGRVDPSRCAKCPEELCGSALHGASSSEARGYVAH